MGNPFEFLTRPAPPPVVPPLGQLPPQLGQIMQPGEASTPPGGMQPQMGPPANPQELAQRTSGWDTFFKAISTPEASQALINAGATMLQPRTGGVSQAGQVAKGLAVGAETFTQKQSDKAESARRDTLTDLQKRQTAAEEKRTGFEGQRVATEQQRANDFHTQTTATLDLLRQQIESATAENTPAARKRKADLELAETALRNAQAANQNADAAAGGSGARMAAAGVQETNNLAQSLLVSKEAKTEAEAIIMASDRLHPAKGKKSPEELTISAYAALPARAKILFPNAGTITDKGGQEAKAASQWMRDQKGEIDTLVKTYAARTNQGALPPSTAAPVGGPGVPGNAPLLSAGNGKAGRPPGQADVAAYNASVQQFPAQKAEIDAHWREFFNADPPQ